MLQALELELLDPPESAVAQAAPDGPFQPLILRRRLPWPSVVVSGLLHCVAVLFLLSLPVLSPDREIEHRKPFNRAAVQLLQFPDWLYVVRPIPAIAKARAVAGSARAMVAVRAAEGGLHKSAIKVRANASARPANAAKLQQTLIRPELPKTEQYDVKLPSFLLWNAPKPVPPPRTLKMDPAPKVAMDNLLQSPKLAAVVEPHLALQPPPAMKNPAALATKTKPQLAQEPSELVQAESAQILSLASVFIPVPRSLEIPALNQVGGSAGAEVGQGSGSKSTGASAANGRDGSGHASGTGGTEGEIAGGTGNLSTGNISIVGDAGGSGAAEGAAAGSGSASVTSARPETGTFDIVIEQSSGEAGIPGAANLLHGAPIYTVYLQVGDWKEWVLEYCAADATPSRTAETGVVQLGSPVRIESPYPLITVRPQVRQTPGKRYFLLHGMIDVKGKPVDFRPVQVVDPAFSEAAISAIRQWKFRPAKRDGAALEVEAVIAIPAPPS